MSNRRRIIKATTLRINDFVDLKDMLYEVVRPETEESNDVHVFNGDVFGRITGITWTSRRWLKVTIEKLGTPVEVILEEDDKVARVDDQS